MITVADLLTTPQLTAARVLAGSAGLKDREVRWISVTELPVDGFVDSGDIVLTTAMGCDDGRFRALIGDVIRADAAALAVSMNPVGDLRTIPASIVSIAEKNNFPLLELPWELPFSEIIRAVTGCVIADQYRSVGLDEDNLYLSLAAVVLDEGGVRSLANALETILSRPVVLLNQDFRLDSAGDLAITYFELENLAHNSFLTGHLTVAVTEDLRRNFQRRTVFIVESIPELEVGRVIVAKITARTETLGYILTPADSDAGIPSVVRRALEQAGVTAAIEMLRRRAVAQTEDRLRGDFLWELTVPNEERKEDLAAQAILLGHSLCTPFDVGVVKVLHDNALSTGYVDPDTSLLEISRFVVNEGAKGILTARRKAEALLLAPTDEAGHSTLKSLLYDVRKITRPAHKFAWGIASRSHTLLDLSHGYRDAVQALEVAHSVYGAGSVGDSIELGPFLMLKALGDDPSAREFGATVLEALVACDEGKPGGLVATLEAFLRANGNSSAAARVLHLNRRSLRYRLKKIESLTGRSLERHDDRLLLEVSLMVRHFRELPPVTRDVDVP